MRTQPFPREGALPVLAPESGLREVLRWAVAHGCAAPSELNSQPWRFVATLHDHGATATLDLVLDERRLLPAVDPTQREAVIACGAALLNVRLALRGAGVGTHLMLCPDPVHPEALARLTTKGTTVESAEDRPLRLAVQDRSTHRGAFQPGEVPEELVERLVAEAAYEGAFVSVLDEQERETLAELNREAEAQLWGDPAFRRGVASWTRPNSAGSEDGVPGFSHGLKAWQAWLEPARIRAGRPSAEELGQERSELEAAPLTMVLGSSSDATAALLRAGAGLERLLLCARVNGLSAGYLNAALHVESRRGAVARALGLDHPQVVLRLGYADVSPRTPRLHQEDVLHVHEVLPA